MNPEERMKEQIGEEVSKHTAKKVGEVVGVVGAIFAGVFFAIFLGFFFGWFIKLLWNYTLADMFGWPQISYWQAVGVFVLAKLFFGFGHSGSRKKTKKKKKEERNGERAREWWRQRMGIDTGETSVSGGLFKQYWQEEGKAAYEAYLAARAGDRGGVTPKTSGE